MPVNSVVTITLNEGPKSATIPQGLVGEDVKDVKNALEDLKFSNVKTVAAKSEDPNTKPGEVTSISPKEGSTVPLDSKITVRYATGKSEVPNFNGLTRAAAIRECQRTPASGSRNSSSGRAPSLRHRDRPEPTGGRNSRSRHHNQTHAGRRAAAAAAAATGRPSRPQNRLLPSRLRPPQHRPRPRRLPLIRIHNRIVLD